MQPDRLKPSDLARSPRRAAYASLVLALLFAAPSVRPDSPCTVRHALLGDYPSLSRTAWSDEAQGITHDAHHWFLTTRSELFKVPASVDLAGEFDARAGVLRAGMPDALASRGFDHLGDLSWHQHGGTGLLCVPVDGGPSAELAFFRASDLAYLASAPLPGSPRSAPFCAIDGVGRLVVGQQQDPVLGRFRVDWSRVVAGERPLSLALAPGLPLLDERGEPLRLDHLQGAAFSQDGRLLHLTTGFFDDHACPPWRWSFWTGGCSVDPLRGGIHVFEVRRTDGGRCDAGDTCQAWRIDKSTNPTQGSADPSSFAYAYRGTLLEAEEPEGITFWDLEAPGAPVVRGARGQVHALLLDNELPSRFDRVSIRHYRVELRCAETASSPGPLR